MSYQRNRNNLYSQTARRSSLSDDDREPTQAMSTSTRVNPSARPSSPLSQLSPPRPGFLAAREDRGSWSSQESSLDPASESEREHSGADAHLTGAYGVSDLTSPVSPVSALPSSGRPPRQQPAHSYRRSSGNGARYAPVAVDTDTPNTASFPRNGASDALRSATQPIPNPFGDSPTQENTPLYPPGNGTYNEVASPVGSVRRGGAAPPSAFPFPYDGADPRGRRTSLDSVSRGGTNLDSVSSQGHQQRSQTVSNAASLSGAAHRFSGSSYDNGDFDKDFGALHRPYAPFMAGGGVPNSPYSGSATGSATGLDGPRMSSSASFRSPFLSPASRPTSWAPPTHAYSGSYPNLPGTPGGGGSRNGSMLNLALAKPKAPMSSTLLSEKLRPEDKPWLQKRDRRGKVSWWLTFMMFWLGVGLAAIIVWRGWTSAGQEMIADSDLCLLMSDDFSSLNVDSDGSTWTREVNLGGFGTGEFEMMTASSDNLYVKNNELYIFPTLTSDSIGTDSIFDGYTFPVDGCTSTDNASACTVTSDNSTDTVVNPVQSARINTKGSYSIKYGKVEVTAKLPTGDWFWPAIWMMPEDNTYGEWPLSGEIDIMEARGNTIEYAGQGSNFVRAAVKYGPLESLTQTLFGWISKKQTTYASGFHTYTMGWTPAFLKIYVDSRLTAMLDQKITLSGGKSFWDKGNFPATAQNGSSAAVIENIYSGGAPSAPFDQNFYLIIDLAVGGTSGWFEDTIGGKPWYDSSTTAMTEFAKAQDTWAATWPSSDADRAFRISSVKMWNLGGC